MAIKVSHGKTGTATMHCWTRRQRVQRRKARASLRHPKHKGKV